MLTHRLICVLTSALVLTAMPAAADDPPPEPSAEPDVYALDGLERSVPANGKMQCPTVPLVTYRGDVLRYHAPVRVYVGFRDRLRKFEHVAREVAIEVYGRAPSKIVHIGTLNCRRIRLWPTLLSEHGIGNGIDIAGFDFAAQPNGRPKDNPLPAALRRSFSVRVKSHWTATGPTGELHAKFLRLLTDRLEARQDIFRVLLGPAYPGHHDHFHFDCAPWRLVEI